MKTTSISLSDTILDKSLEKLENDYWEKPVFQSHLVSTCHKIRKIPLKNLSVEHLRMAIGQKMGLSYLMPLAIRALEIDPLLEAHFYEGDLLQNVLQVGDTYFDSNKNFAKAIVVACENAIRQTNTRSAEFGDKVLLDLATSFIEKYKL